MGHSCVSEITYADFARPLLPRLIRERIPVSGTVELTHRCNLACGHCYCNQPSGNKAIKDKELSTPELCAFLDDIARKGCIWILFTGGEPFVREDFRDVYLYAKKKGFIITLFTNATLVTNEVADFLKEWPPYQVEVTLYGATRKVYEQMTGFSGSFDACMAGIERLRTRGLAPNLKTMVSAVNKDELWEMKRFAKERNLLFRFDTLFHSRIDGSQKPAGYRISPEEVIALDVQDSEVRAEWERAALRAGEVRRDDYLYRCGAGVNLFNLDPYGRVSMCSTALAPSYDIHTYAFDVIWDRFFPEELKRKYEKNRECYRCDAAAFCAQCPGWAQMEHQDPELKVGYLCEIAKLRSRQFRVTGDQDKTGGAYGEKKVLAA